MNIHSDRHKKLLENYQLKLFSLLCASFLWFYVVTDNYFEHSDELPVRLTNQPEGWILTQPLPEHVKVRFRGTGKAFLSFNFQDKFVELDLHQRHLSDTLPISLDMIRGVPQALGIEALDVLSPQSIYVDMDRYMVKKVPVLSQLTMKTLDGYIQIGQTSFEPDSVQISGPMAVIDTINSVGTESKIYKNLLKPIDDDVILTPPPMASTVFEPNIVHFNADIQRIGERVMSDIPVTVQNVPRDVNVNVIPSTLTLKLQGGVGVLAKLNTEDIQASIDYQSRNRHQGKRVPATIHVPLEVTFSEVRPKYFELIVER